MGKRVNTAVWMEARGRWQINVQKDGVRKTFTSSKPGRNGQREANAKADEWLDDDVDHTTLRVSSLWEKYLEREKSISDENYKQASYVGESYILPLCGTLKIGKLTEAHLQTILDKAYNHGSFKLDAKQRKPASLPLSRKTLSNILSQEKKFIKYCRLYKATTLFPESLHVPEASRLKDKNILQPESLSVLFTIDTTLWRGKRIFDEYIYAYRFQVACGLRPGELLGLCYGDISKDGTVKIRRSINTDSKETQGKNQNAVRSFVMCRLAKEAYDAQVNLLHNSGIPLNFNTPLFQITCQHSYYGRWTAYLKSNNQPHISPYELRHTFVSIAKFLPAGQIKPIVGHSKSMDTFGVYGHIITGESKQTSNDITNLFEKVLSGT